jgi:prolyl oligopeptidase
VKFSGAAWTKDGKGFYYSRYDAPTGDDRLLAVNRDQKLYYHRVGTPQSADVLVYARPDHPLWGFSAGVTESGRYAVISVWEGTDERNRLYYIDLKDPLAPDVAGKVVPLLDAFDATYDFIDDEQGAAGAAGAAFLVRTNKDAPRSRVVAVRLDDASPATWRELIPQTKDALTGVRVAGGMLAAEYLEDAKSSLRLHDRASGRLVRTVQLPTIGTVAGVSGRRVDRDLHYAFTSFLSPTTIYRLDLATGTSTVHRAPKVPFDTAKYETKQVFYTSRDGTRVPMFLVHRRGLVLDGNNPTLLYGYGGFNVPMVPGFSPATLTWLEMGGVYAQASLRGGGEYGEEWHKAGTKAQKQNVFDDFIAAGEWLVAQRYTRPAKLSIMGGSNGGLLVGAAITQRPDLFGAALPAVGVMDMLRFHKFTIGWAWTSDYGSPDDSTMFPVLRAYSPLHNLKPGTRYPATMITTGDHDDRVVPGHSFKFAAAMQQAQGGAAPVLIRIETRGGHGAGKPTAMQIEEWADRFAFLSRELGMQPTIQP